MDRPETNSAPPTGLTEAEQQLLALVRDGRVDAEIGVRLGLPVSEVKARIERLCARFGVADKAALRNLTFAPEPLPDASPGLRRPARRRWALAIVALAAAITTALSVIAIRSTLRDAHEAAPTPVTVGGIIAPPLLTVALSSPLTDLAIIAQRTCPPAAENCTGIQSIDRLFFDADGDQYEDTLLTPNSFVDGAPLEGNRIDGVAALGSGQMLATVSLTSGGTSVLASSDGGITWSQFAAAAAATLMPLEYMDDGVLVQHADGSYDIVAPSGGEQPVPGPGERPVGLGPGGELLWATGPRIVSPAGLTPLDVVLPAGSTIVAARFFPRYAQWSIAATATAPAVAGVGYRKFAGSENAPTVSWTDVPGRIAGYIDASHVVTTMNASGGAADPLRNIPGIIDLVAGTIAPIHWLGGPETRGPNFVLAADHAAFVLANGACLKAQPSEEAPDGPCPADHVLLTTNTPEGRKIPGWILVNMPDGRSSGWLHVK